MVANSKIYSVCLFLILMLMLAIPCISYGETFYVSTTKDQADGYCTPGDCTLREAVMAANANGMETHDIITIPAGEYVLTEKGTSEYELGEKGDLDIKTHLTIWGAGADKTIIDGNGTDRVFEIADGLDVNISGVTITNGNAGDLGCGGISVGDSDVVIDNSIITDNKGKFGGGISVDGNSANLKLENCTISKNTSEKGGGIHGLNGAHVEMINTTVSDNKALGGEGGGGIHIKDSTLIFAGGTISGNSGKTGGGIYISDTEATMSNCTISGNEGSYGGGVFGGVLTMDGCKVIKNEANDDGGGLYLSGEDIMQIKGSIISDNAAGSDGGGILIHGPLNMDATSVKNNTSKDYGGGIYEGETTGNITISNSAIVGNITKGSGGGLFSELSDSFNIVNTTIAKNQAISYEGGGIYNLNGPMKCINCTIADNIATLGGGIFQKDSNGKFEIQNTILTDNSAASGYDCQGEVTSLGNNVIGNIDDCIITKAGGDVFSNAGAVLDSFEDNGQAGNGHYVLLSTGKAVNSGNPAACLPLDQIGNKRVGVCDIGAIEAPATKTLKVEQAKKAIPPAVPKKNLPKVPKKK